MIPQMSIEPKFVSLHYLAVARFATHTLQHEFPSTVVFSLNAYISLVPVAQILRCFKSQVKLYCSPGSLLDFFEDLVKKPKLTSKQKPPQTNKKPKSSNLLSSMVPRQFEEKVTLSIQLCKNYNFLRVLE